MKDINEQRVLLNELDIIKLRGIGWEVGVLNPTTLKKGTLIDEILAVSPEYEIDPKLISDKKKRGRPPKTLEEAEEQTEEPTVLKGVEIFKAVPKNFVKNSDIKNIKQTNEVKDDTYSFKTPVRPRMVSVAEPEIGYDSGLEEKIGILDIHPDGYGFLRVKNCEPGEGDAYISAMKIRRSGLRRGDMIKAQVKAAFDNKPAGVVNILTLNGKPFEENFRRPNFDDLVPVYPDERYKLETEGSKFDFAIRSIDLIAPIGKGQRAMIVSPPKAGKTTLLKKIANSISVNYPESHLMVLLVDERPEEVTDMQRSIKGEVVYSTFDEMPEHHTKAAELVLERAKRLVELKRDVVILMDSLTRLARAYNLTIAPTGRTLSGGIDPGALHSPKRFFGAARNIEHGGSLTIIATALVDTGSRMDDVIYEEFKGTGNMEIHLDRKLSEKRIFPAIDLNKSGTRREDLLLTQKELEGIWNVRKMLSSGDTAEATENLMDMMTKTYNNEEFIDQLSLQMIKLQKEGIILRK